MPSSLAHDYWMEEQAIHYLTQLGHSGCSNILSNDEQKVFFGLDLESELNTSLKKYRDYLHLQV